MMLSTAEQRLRAWALEPDPWGLNPGSAPYESVASFLTSLCLHF